MAAMAAIALASDAADASAVPGAEELNPVSFLQFTKSSEVVMVDCKYLSPNQCQVLAYGSVNPLLNPQFMRYVFPSPLTRSVRDAC